MEYLNQSPCGFPIHVCFLLVEERILSNLQYHIVVQTFDLGQNIVGWCRFKFQGASGRGVYIHHGEVLTKPDINTK